MQAGGQAMRERTRAGNAGRGAVRRWSVRGSALVVVLALAVVTMATVSGSRAVDAASGPATLGMRTAGGSPTAERFAAAEAWLRRPLAWTVAMTDRDSPSAMRSSTWAQLGRSDALLPRMADRLDLDLTVPLAFGSGSARDSDGRAAIREKLLETASGRWDADYAFVADMLAASGYGDGVVRLGHEMTGPFYPWSAQGNGDAYIAAFQHVRDVMRAEAPGLRFEWNAARNTFIAHGPSAYPGDDYVDVIGLDVYYEPTKGDPVPLDDAAWARRFQPVLQAHLDFAVMHGKPVSYAEWASGDIDDPRFVERMHQWFSALPAVGPGRLLYQSYFNVNRSTYDLAGYPRSAWAYQRLFGVVADGTPMYTGTGSDEVLHLYRSGTEIGTMTLARVSSSGDTVVRPRAAGVAGGPEPAGFRLGTTEPVLLDLSTTATYSGPISVCLRFAPEGFDPAQTPQMLAADGTTGTGAWENVTRALDRAGGVVCGAPPSVATLAIGTGFDTAPDAADVVASLGEDTAAELTLRATDRDGDDVVFEVGEASSGTVGVPSPSTCSGTYPRVCTATVAYRPDADFFGADGFSVRAGDGRAWSHAARVSLRVEASPDLPRANAGEVRTAEDAAAVLSLSGRDPDGGSLAIELVDGPQHGSVGLAVAPSCHTVLATTCTAEVRYVPAADWSGTDAFTWAARTVTGAVTASVPVFVEPVNDAPSCAAVTLGAPEDGVGEVPLQCADVDGDPLGYRLVTDAGHGSPAIAGSQLSYRPQPDFHGADAFTYAAFDGLVSSVPATVGVTVAPVQDVPQADDVRATVVEDVVGPVVLGGTDADGEALAFEITSPPTHGTLDPVGAPGCSGTGPSVCRASVLYRPEAGYDGLDAFRYRVSDGIGSSEERTATIEVTAVLDPTTLTAVVPAVDADGNGFSTVSATLASPDPTCIAAQSLQVEASADGTTWTVVATARTGADGRAVAEVAFAPGVFEVRVRFPGNAGCAASLDRSSPLAVGVPGDRVLGGGWYRSPLSSVVRAGFGVTVPGPSGLPTPARSTATAGGSPGALLWIQPGVLRLRSTSIDTVRPAPSCNTARYRRCSVITGKALVSRWRPDATAPDGGTWSAGTGVAFTVTVGDGGSGSSCTGHVCSPVDRPDGFAVSVSPKLFSGQGTPALLPGGSLSLG